MDLRAKLRQIFAAFTASMSGISIGSCISWINFEEHSEESKNDQRFGKFSFDIIAFFMVAGFFASVSVFVTRWRGPLLTIKLGAMLSFLIWTISTSLLRYGNPFHTTCYLLGIICGVTAAPISLYVGEIASKEIRGALAGFLGLNIKIGILIGDLSFVQKEFLVPCVMLVLILTLQIVLLFQIHEAPLFLLLNNKFELANEALVWLRGEEFDGKSEIEYLENMALLIQSHSMLKTILKCFRACRAWLIMLGVIFFYHSTGVVFAYLVADYVFKKSLGNMPVYIPDLAVDVSQIISVTLSLWLIDKIGRRVVLITTSAGITVAAFMLAACLRAEYFGWLSLTTLLVYVMMFAAGFEILLWVTISEVFPVDCKIFACTLSVAVAFFCRVVIAGMAQFCIYKKIVENDPRFGYAFYLFGASMILSLIFALIYVPELTRKSFWEIQEILK